MSHGKITARVKACARLAKAACNKERETDREGYKYIYIFVYIERKRTVLQDGDIKLKKMT